MIHADAEPMVAFGVEKVGVLLMVNASAREIEASRLGDHLLEAESSPGRAAISPRAPGSPVPTAWYSSRTRVLQDLRPPVSGFRRSPIDTAVGRVGWNT